MKKQSLLIIAALFLTSLTAYSQFKIEDGVIYDIMRSQTPRVEALVLAYAGDRGHVNILRTYQVWPSVEVTVTRINGLAFQNTGLTGVTIPNSVTSIGYWAFLDNPNLATLVPGPADPPTNRNEHL